MHAETWIQIIQSLVSEFKLFAIRGKSLSLAEPLRFNMIKMISSIGVLLVVRYMPIAIDGTLCLEQIQEKYDVR